MIDLLALVVVGVPMIFGTGFVLLSTIIPDPQQKANIVTLGNMVNLISFSLTLAVLTFGAKGLFVPVIAIAMLGMMYLSFGEEGFLEFELGRFKINFQKLPPVEMLEPEDEPEPDHGGRVIKFERRSRRDGPRSL